MQLRVVRGDEEIQQATPLYGRGAKDPVHDGHGLD